jgi:hypothetical protein
MLGKYKMKQRRLDLERMNGGLAVARSNIIQRYDAGSMDDIRKAFAGELGEEMTRDLLPKPYRRAMYGLGFQVYKKGQKGHLLFVYMPNLLDESIAPPLEYFADIEEELGFDRFSDGSPKLEEMLEAQSRYETLSGLQDGLRQRITNESMREGLVKLGKRDYVTSGQRIISFKPNPSHYLLK